MSKLLLSKHTEAKVIAAIWEMGIESLNPDDFDDVERIIKNITNTRHINSETIKIERTILNGYRYEQSHKV